MVIAAFATLPTLLARSRNVLRCIFRPGLLTALVIVDLAFFSGSLEAEPKIIGNNSLLPQSIAEFRRGSVTDYEAEKPGLGYSVAYSQPGWRADVYIYDFRRKSIPPGPKSSAVAAQMQQAKAEIHAIQKAGLYSAVSFKSNFDIADATGRPVFTCMSLSMQIVRMNMQAFDSYLCLTSSANKFVKVRISGAQALNSEKVARRFVGALANIISGY